MGRQYGPAGSGCRGTVKSQFCSVATQSVEKPCVLLESRLGRGRGTAEEMQLRMATKGKSIYVFGSFREASTIQDHGALSVAVHGRISRSQVLASGGARSLERPDPPVLVAHRDS